jgi:hypothetical protein
MPRLNVPDGCLSITQAATLIRQTRHRTLLDAAHGRLKTLTVPGRPMLITRESAEARRAEIERAMEAAAV